MSAVAGGLAPPDVAAGGARCGDGDAGLDHDLVGVGSDGDPDGFAGVRPGQTRTVCPVIAGPAACPMGESGAVPDGVAADNQRCRLTCGALIIEGMTGQFPS